MKGLQSKEKFIELRVQGLSFDKISREINVSKPTLIKWDQEFSREIVNLLFFNSEKLLEEFRLLKIHKIEALVRTAKLKQREDFPLRGLLVCPKCSRNLTGSLSKGRNGNYYGYYHCQNACKARFSADCMHDKLHDYLKSLTIPSEIYGHP